MRRERVLVVIAIVAAAVFGVVVGAVLLGGDDGGGTATTTSRPPADGVTEDGEPGGEDGPEATDDPGANGDEEPSAPSTTYDVGAFSGDAGELAAALNRAAGLTYHAVYQAVDHDITIEIWRRPPLARRDTRTRDAESGAELAVSEYRLANGAHVGCLQQEGEGLCVHADESDEEAIDPGDPVIGAVDPGAGEVRAYDETVRGTAVRCFDVAGGGDDGEDATACFDADGIPFVIDGGEDRLERTDLGRGVADETLQPPSQPIEVPEPSTTVPAGAS